jgi:DNA-binding GntR family transcriptional regulator
MANQRSRMPADADYLGTLNHDAPETASQQIAEHLRSAIVAGVLPPDQRLPSQPALAAHYGVARETVKTALAQLAREGLIHSQKGRGTFVRGARSHGEGHLRAELVELQQRLRRLRLELVTVEATVSGVIGSLQEVVRQAQPDHIQDRTDPHT